jgi:hypothetical protein
METRILTWAAGLRGLQKCGRLLADSLLVSLNPKPYNSADCAEPTLLVLGRVGGSPLRVWRCPLQGGVPSCSLVSALLPLAS